MRQIFKVLVVIAGFIPGIVQAQTREETLADIRQEMSVLYVEIQKLKRELSTTGASGELVVGGGTLDRVNAIEGELQRLTSKTEKLEFRIDQVVRDGTNRLGDLEFRLCELTTNCDISTLPPNTTLGGDTPAAGGTALPNPDDDLPQLAEAEEADFKAAEAAMEAGDYAGAADQFSRFRSNYPGSPLSDQAAMLRGRALETSGDLKAAGRAYLDLFSENNTGPMAAGALSRLGIVLGNLGKIEDACVTLGEVEARFPQSDAVLEANSAMRNLGCL
ncbi:Cell division coordinator CpoB [hydrothermal vent metagenome]|uniref:Cell division coordinator CpoB n=1 Tax=hydrothermal vent metagenome TaxID=652676 RepID=A0A3B0RUV1_9ZZZZ